MKLYHFIYNDKKTDVNFAISVWEEYAFLAAERVKEYIRSEKRYKGVNINLRTIKDNISKQEIFKGIHADVTVFPKQDELKIGCCGYTYKLKRDESK